MVNITSDSSPSKAVMLYGNVLSYAELVVHPISLMTSFFTVALIINTSVLHSNLKCILLGQSAGIVMFEIARTVYVVIKFVAGNVFFQGPIAIQMLGLFGYTLRNVVSHVLIAERTIATIKFRTYGQFNWVGFTTLWLTASIGISSWITFSQEGSPWSVSPIAMISICVVFGTGLIEITTLIFLQVYNLRKYRSSRTGVNLSLNDKYQISENIRTARQLAPTFVLHFLNACVNNGMSFLIFFDVIQHTYSISLGFIISSLFNGFSGALVDLIVIMHHPLLKKKAKHWLLYIFQFQRGPAGQIRVEDNVVASKRQYNQLKNIYGQTLLDRSEREDHFKMLRNQWTEPKNN